MPRQCAHWLAMTCKRRVRVSECKAVLPSKPAGGCGFCHWADVLANADTQQISACHCEERSDGTIRSPCSTTSQKAVLWANTKKCYEFAQKRIYRCLSLRGCGLPQVCALVRNDMQKTGTRQRMQGGGTRGKVRRRWQFCLVQRPCLCGHAACFCMSLRGAQRRGNPFSLQYNITESSTLGEYEKMLRIRPKAHLSLPFPAGMRIATGVRTGSQ